MKRIPNLFIVGAPKCGTTALHEYLKQHPEIYMSEIKEPLYFAKDFINEGIKFHGKQIFGEKNLKDYLKLFDKATNQKIIGESSVWYFTSKIAAKEIYNFNQKAKIIIMLRNPVDLLYSIHSQFVYDGDEKIIDFTKALNIEPLRREGKLIPKYVSFPSMLYYSQVTRFSKNILRYKKIFPKDQIKIVILEEFKKNPEKGYKEILDFLGVDTNFIPNFKVINPNKIPRNNYLVKLLKTPSLRYFIRDIFPAKFRIKVGGLIEVFNKKNVPREPINCEVRGIIYRKYKKEILKLNKITRKNMIKVWMD